MGTNSVGAGRVFGGRIPLRKIVLAGLAAVVAAVIANVVVLFVVRAIFPQLAGFMPLQVGPIAIFTAGGVALGAIVFAILSRTVRNPVRTFTLVAVIALVVSLIPNLLFVFNPAAGPAPGGSALGYGLLMIFHVVAAAVSVPVLTALARR